MVRSIKYFFCLCCIFLFSVIQAQDTLITVAPSTIEPDVEVSTDYYDRKEFSYYDSAPRVKERKIGEKALNNVRNDDAYWYANLEPPKKEEKKSQPKIEVRTNWFNTFFWILLIGGFLALLIWLLSSSNISFLRRSPDEIESDVEEPEENIFERNFDKEIQAAADAKNYRLAVRLMYLQVLRLMADKRMIQYAADKTNGDYLLQLSSTRYYGDFFRLTRNFDYVWYGKFPVSDEGFHILQKDFFTFKQTLR
jgi:hypothetical protein